MIHILEYKNCWFDRNPDILIQYVNMPIILERLLAKTNVIGELISNKNYIHKEIFEGDDLFDTNILSDYIESNTNISILFFNADIFKNSITTANDSINYLSKKYPNIRFLVLTQETFLTYTKQSFDNKNVFYIINSLSNPYEYVATISKMERVANYYIMNTYLQHNYNTFLNSLFHQTRDLVRTKKYNFFNGIHKPHRLKCYEIIKNNNMLDDGYFSYVDFAYFKNDEEQYQEFMEFLGFDSTESYLTHLNGFKIPYLCDTTEVNPNVFVAFAIPPQYSLQSYVSITTETYFFENENARNVNFSEKSLKSFYGFNIPLILGQPTSIRYLKDLGFDMFEDLFDLTPKYTRKEIFEQFDNNVKVINSMSKMELHEYYVSNLNRIHNNFETLTKRMVEYDLYNLNNFLDIPL
jgi:hypothetical protein